MSNFYTYNKRNETTVDIHLYGIIGVNEKNWNEGTNNKPHTFITLLKKLDKQFDRVNIHVSSPGGSISAGLAIYNTIVNMRNIPHIYNDGFVGSMASIIILAGITHFPKASVFHLHSAWKRVSGNRFELEDAITELNAFESVLINVIQKKTKLSTEEITKNWFDGREHVMSASKAKEFGFVDFLEEQEVELPAAAATADLAKMEYEQICKVFTPKQIKTETAFAKVRKAIFGANDKPKTKAMSLISSKSLPLVFALFAIQKLPINETGKIDITPDQLIATERELEAKNSEIAKATAQLEASAKKLEEANARIEELQKEIDEKPQAAANPKTEPKTDINKIRKKLMYEEG